MSRLPPMTHIDELVLANRVLDYEGVVDAYGHVSMRDPENPSRFLLSCARSPGIVVNEDIIAFDMSGEPEREEARPLYSERFIHAGVYAARPDIGAVVHSHAEDTLSFSINTSAPLKPVIHSASNMGGHVPLWDIAERFGDTNLLVTNMEQARDMAARLGDGYVVLMCGHGFVAAAPTLIEAVRLAVYLPKNARVQAKAMAMGGNIRTLSDGEIAARRFNPNTSKTSDYDPNGPGLRRAWDYWRVKMGHERELKGTHNDN